jgi:hypothetical protein
MSPELEKLLEAYDAQRSSPPREKERLRAIFQLLLDEALAKMPGTSREALFEALQGRYREFCRARRKPTTLPPKA